MRSEHLTPREAEVAYAIGVLCLNTKAAGLRLGLSPRTVETHRKAIFGKFGLAGGAQWNVTAQLARILALEGLK